MKLVLQAYYRDLRFGMRHPLVRRTMYVLMASVALTLAMLLGYAIPAWREHARLEAALDSQRQLVAERRQHADLVETVKRTNAEIGKIEKKLDARGVQITLVKALSQLARQNGIRILDSSYDEGKAQNGYAPLFHELTVEGGYSGLRQFLIDLDKMPTFSLVREASLSPAGEGTSRLKAHLRMVTYRKTTAGEGAP